MNEILAILLFQEDMQAPEGRHRNWFTIPLEDRSRYRKAAQKAFQAERWREIEDAYQQVYYSETGH